jgi:hypothetical protein
MINGGQIAQGAITDNKVGKNANIKYSKLDKANEGEVLVAQGDGRLKAVRISGDARMSTTGKLTVSLPEVSLDEDAVKKSDIKEGKTLVGGPTKPEEVAVGTGSNAIPQRDSSGNLKAETADLATNADKLDDQEGTHYLDVTNHTAGTSTTTTGSNGVSWTTQTVPFEEVVATFQYQYNGTGYGGTSFPIVHNLGYIPSCKTYKVDGSNLEEVEMNVVSTTTTTTVSFNYINFDMKVILR